MQIIRRYPQHSTRLWPLSSEGTVALVVVGVLLVVAFMGGVQVGRSNNERPTVAMEVR